MEIIEMIWQCPSNERIIGIVQWRDMVIVTTDQTVYRVTDDGRDLIPIKTR